MHFARQAVLAQLAGLPSLLRALLTDREPPDTPLTRAVLELAGSSYAEPLLGHCLRTWLWGERPDSRAAVLWRLGMRLPLNHNPLDRKDS